MSAAPGRPAPRLAARRPAGGPGARATLRSIAAVTLPGILAITLASCGIPPATPATDLSDLHTHGGPAAGGPGDGGAVPRAAPHAASGLNHLLKKRRTCDDGAPATASYAPQGAKPGVIPAGSTMAAIRERGSLRVGVSADTLRMSARNPFTGEIEGFDIDVARAVAKAIFGSPDKVTFRVITSAQRERVLVDHEVDVVVRTFTITCERWEDVAFSAEYYHAGQKLLVPVSSKVAGVGDLDGQRVCAPQDTTSLAMLGTWEGVRPVAAATHTQCLALFQMGQVDALTGDDTVLAGFAAQDPYAKVVGDAVSDEPYGIGVPADQKDMVRFVNAVLEQRARDGGWRGSHDRWLTDVLGGAPRPPEPVYGRDL